MKRTFHILDQKFKPYWKNYLFQTLCATIFVSLILLFSEMVDMIIIASIGASTFVLFAMPKYPQARDRNLIGGQLIGLICGSLFSLVPHSSFYSDVMVDALAVGLTFFIMVLTETEHPPAAGTALGVVVAGFSLEIAISVIASVMLLSLIHRCLRRFLIDLV